MTSDLSRETVETIFQTLARRYTTRWKANFEDSEARKVWLVDLQRAGVTDRQALTALDESRRFTWPPTVGEFIELAQAPEQLGVPDLDSAFREAVRAAVSREWNEHEWSHPVVYHAASHIGPFALRTKTERELVPQFRHAYRVMLRRYREGEDLQLPVRKALPKERTIPLEERQRIAAKYRQQLHEALHGKRQEDTK